MLDCYAYAALAAVPTDVVFMIVALCGVVAIYFAYKTAERRRACKFLGRQLGTSSVWMGHSAMRQTTNAHECDDHLERARLDTVQRIASCINIDWRLLRPEDNLDSLGLKGPFVLDDVQETIEAALSEYFGTPIVIRPEWRTLGDIVDSVTTFTNNAGR